MQLSVFDGAFVLKQTVLSFVIFQALKVPKRGAFLPEDKRLNPNTTSPFFLSDYPKNRKSYASFVQAEIPFKRNFKGDCG